MAPRRLWVLNLDAEVELGRPKGYHPSQRTLRQLDPRLAEAARLLAPGEPVVDPLAPTRVRLYPLVRAHEQGAPDAIDSATSYRKRQDVGSSSAGHAASDQWASASTRGLQGAAWCPTPYALLCLARLGAVLPAAPPLGVLQSANSRLFCAQLGQTLPGARFEVDPERAVRFLCAHQSDAWLLKRPLGFAGRGQRALYGALRPDDHRFIEQSADHGGLQIEPLVDIHLEVVIHGHIEPGGSFVLGPLRRQRVDAHRAWLNSGLLAPDDLSNEHAVRIHDEAARVAAALHQLGYFGPFGMDAFVYKSRDGRFVLNPRSEINARYCMGFALAESRP